MIVDGACGYVYNASTGIFTTISGGGWPAAGAGTLTYIDGYFVIGNGNSMSASASNLYDGTTWNALATSPISAGPDLVQAVINVHQQLWIIKEYTSEVWYDAGTPTTQGFPFSRISGAVIDYGTPAPIVRRPWRQLIFLPCQPAEQRRRGVCRRRRGVRQCPADHHPAGHRLPDGSVCDRQ